MAFDITQTPHYATINEAAKRYNLVGELPALYTIYGNESSFGKGDVSGSNGAYGPMQVRLGAIKDYDKAHGTDYASHPQDLTGDLGVDVGTWYYGQQLKSTKGNRRDALGQYTLGPGDYPKYKSGELKDESKVKQINYYFNNPATQQFIPGTSMQANNTNPPAQDGQIQPQSQQQQPVPLSEQLPQQLQGIDAAHLPQLIEALRREKQPTDIVPNSNQLNSGLFSNGKVNWTNVGLGALAAIGGGANNRAARGNTTEMARASTAQGYGWSPEVQRVRGMLNGIGSANYAPTAGYQNQSTIQEV